MTFEQTVEIPADHRITVEVPPEIPAGAARLKLSIFQSAAPQNKPAKISRQMKKLMRLYGCLKDSPAFAGDSVETIRTMREEWNRPPRSVCP